MTILYRTKHPPNPQQRQEKQRLRKKPQNFHNKLKILHNPSTSRWSQYSATHKPEMQPVKENPTREVIKP